MLCGLVLGLYTALISLIMGSRKGIVLNLSVQLILFLLPYTSIEALKCGVSPILKLKTIVYTSMYRVLLLLLV